MTDQKEEREYQAEEYDGPYIEKRLEWKCPDRKRHTVVLFGSWNRFKGGDELEYQGKQVFAVTVQLPLGNYVYRFLVDNEDWETHNSAPKTAKNGIEYNQIHVTEGDSDDDEEEEDDFDNEGTTNTTLVMSDNGQLTIGTKTKKRRGRPSMELDLGAHFHDEGDEGDEGDDNDNDNGDLFDEEDDVGANTKDSQTEVRDINASGDAGSTGIETEAAETAETAETGTGGTDGTATATETGSNVVRIRDNLNANSNSNSNSNKKKHKKRHKRGKKHKRKKKGNRKKGEQMAEKEWARYVFVQQLRQQQQHNDEINRVKTLWKQERQVRVEMHKKVVKQMKQCKKELASAQVEIERLQKQAKIGKESDERDSATLKVQIEKMKSKIEHLNEQLKLKEAEFTAYRQERVVSEKINRENKDDWGNTERKYKQEIVSFKTQVKTMTSTITSLQSSLETLRDDNKKTLQSRAAQYEERCSHWETEKKEFLRKLQETQQLRETISDLEATIESTRNALSESNKQNLVQTTKSATIEQELSKLKQELEGVKNSNEATEKVKQELSKAKLESDANNRISAEQLAAVTKQMAEQKTFYEKQAFDAQEQHKQETAAFKANSDKQMTEHIERLNQDIQARDADLQRANECVSKLESSISSSDIEKQELIKKVQSSVEECTHLQQEINAKSNELNKVEMALSQLRKQSDAAAKEAEEAETEINKKKEKIGQLQNSLKEEHAASQSRIAEKQQEIDSLRKQISGLNESLNSKSQLLQNVTSNLNNVTEKLNQSKISWSALQDEVVALEQQLVEEEKNRAQNSAQYEQQLEKLHSESNARLNEKDAKITNLQTEIRKIEADLIAKLQEFNQASTTIQELNANIEADRQKFANARKDFDQSLLVYQEKDDRIHNACKALFQKFTGMRDEMKSIKETQIQQLEELHNFFAEFSPLLAKVFRFNQGMIDDLLGKYKRELSLRRKYFNLVQDLRGNIRVFCRVRPLLKFEIAKKYSTCLKFPAEGAVVVKDKKGDVPFEFDQVYAPETTQEQVSEDATEYIQSVMDGYNVSIFAYGQTGSGKTYTMEGPSDNPGVNIRALSHLFKLAEQRAPQFQYKIKVAVFEVYNENIVDLIETANPNYSKKSKKKKGGRQKYKIRHLPDGGVEVADLTWITVTSDADVLALNKIAKKHRKMAATAMNKDSSRSHMLLVVDVQGINIPANIQYFGKLYLVDLAGSERVKKSGATGIALKEAANINKSLSALGDVMQALQRKEKFIPYRNSTLTDLMSNALGGNAKTIMFINCCPTDAHAFETLSSLKFASRVGKVELGQAKKNVNKKKK